MKCRGHRCTCQEYVLAGMAGTYPTCKCGHTSGTHEKVAK